MKEMKEHEKEMNRKQIGMYRKWKEMNENEMEMNRQLGNK